MTSTIRQEPAPGEKLLKWVGDVLEIKAYRSAPSKGRMVFRTNIGAAGIRRDEVLAQVEDKRLLSGDDWHDIPMEVCGEGVWRVKIALLEVGVFGGKVCFIPDTTPVPEWTEGGNLVVKVAPEHTCAGNTIYAAFTRQFIEPYMRSVVSPKDHYAKAEASMDKAGYTVIPPSGTFRSLIRQLDHICFDLGFSNVLLLPIHPTPTTFARMGRYGSPFAGRDFLDIDPALAEFDTSATPLDQFRELVSAVHARDAAIFMDLPANHTGWAATFMTHHPEWYRRNDDGSFHSPGAWGVVWEDLVELDYSNEALRKAIADVFLYWCRQGVDGFRCDAGYMIPQEAWDVIVALVRREYPDTVFLLEGLGGPLDTTERLIGQSGLDWAYSEVFQTYDRNAFEAMLPYMIQLSQTRGPLIHFAETHDNNRLAATSKTFAKSRMMISAMLSQQGGFGITAGVEWFATEKIDVHGCGALNWGAHENACQLLRRLNTILRTHPLFGVETRLTQIHHGGGNVIAILREREGHLPLLILANLDCQHVQTVHYDTSRFTAKEGYDLIHGETYRLSPKGVNLAPGQVCCLSTQGADLSAIEAAMRQRQSTPIHNLSHRRRRTMMLRTLNWLGEPIDLDKNLDEEAFRFIADPMQFTMGPHGTRCTLISLPNDFTRIVPILPNGLIFVKSPTPFRATLRDTEDEVIRSGRAIALADGTYGLILTTKRRGSKPQPQRNELLTLAVERYTPQGVIQNTAQLFALGQDPQKSGYVKVRFSGPEVNTLKNGRLLLTNGTGAMSQIRLKWGEIDSQYDCLLALNRHPVVPDDRQIFFTRCLGWIICNGYNTPLTSACLEHVTIAPDGSVAEWRFAVPCGMGRRVPLLLRVALEPGKNRVLLRFKRERKHPRYRDPDVSVGLILRPEIEWRNFHCKTKAFTGPEKAFPAATKALADGFDFTPENHWDLAMRMPGADWNPDPKWTYNISHPEEIARGQEGASDLWSPGWFHIELNRGENATLIAGQSLATRLPRVPALTAELPSAPMPIEEAMTAALTNYIVRRDNHKTVIAGYPWFLDWGRDTLIFLRGVAAAGRWDEVFDALTEFGRFEKGGTIPNMIRGEDDANRETVDAPLWFAVICDDAIEHFGAKRVLQHPCGTRTLKDILLSIAENYIKGTSNGIHVDPQTGLVWAPHHYTWMDTNYPAGTPRNGYSVEIQALWVRLLDLLGREVAPKWKRLASRVRRSFRELFPLPDGNGLSDCLYAERGVSAKHAEQDDAIRPNQLYAITLGLLKREKALARSVLRATASLLTPGAIRTLAHAPVKRPLPIQRDGRLLNDPHNPYWGRYEGDEDTRRKPAYHNGTAWTFPFPLYPEALFLVEGEGAREHAHMLLSSGSALANIDCVTQLPECAQGDAPHQPCGTGAQAWGVSEFARVGRLLTKKIPTPQSL